MKVSNLYFNLFLEVYRRIKLGENDYIETSKPLTCELPKPKGLGFSSYA